jgi:glutaredoxin
VKIVGGKMCDRTMRLLVAIGVLGILVNFQEARKNMWDSIISNVYAQAPGESGTKKYSSDVEAFLDQGLPNNPDRLISFDPEKGILTITDTPNNHVLIEELVRECPHGSQEEKSATSSLEESEEELDDERKRQELEQKIKSTTVPVVSFDNAPVQEVIEQLANMTGVNLFLDPLVLTEAAGNSPSLDTGGLSASVPLVTGHFRVTFKTVAPLSLWTLLDTMLATVGLNFYVEPELIRISKHSLYTIPFVKGCPYMTRTYRLKTRWQISEDEEKRRELKKKVKEIYLPAMSFNEVPIPNVVKQLTDMTRIAIFIDSAVLEEPANVTFKTVAPLNLEALLDAMLETVGLSLKVEPELIRISTPKRLESETLVTKVYPLKYGVRKTRKVELKEYEKQ